MVDSIFSNPVSDSPTADDGRWLANDAAWFDYDGPASALSARKDDDELDDDDVFDDDEDDDALEDDEDDHLRRRR